jgi:DNA-binding MurR/RpiR family transcriptional regulator
MRARTVSASTIRLDDDQLDELAARTARHLAALLIDAPNPRPALLTAAELAAELGVDVKTVYRNADSLGAIHVGGARRFDPAVARSVRSAQPLDKAQRDDQPHRVATRRSKPARELLPVGSRRAA